MRNGPIMPSWAALALVLALGACGGNDNDPGPGGVTVGEARALDEAAEMIEQRRPPAGLAGQGSVQPENRKPGSLSASSRDETD